MAIGWLTALKFVPWGDVIEAAPVVVDSARKFFSRTRQAAPTPDATHAAGDTIGPESPHAQWQTRVERLEAEVALLAEQQRASAALIQSLAEQNARLVQTLDILRKRSAALLLATGAVAVGALAALAWFGR